MVSVTAAAAVAARVVAVATLAATLACGGGGWPHLVTTRELDAAGGAPTVRRVVDLGDVAELAATGPVPKDSDGVYVVGELVLIEGDDFGKQPTVLIGGRPAAILGRASGGGIVTRIPAGVAAGEVEVEVSHLDGRGVRAITVRRYGLVAEAGAGIVHALSVGAGVSSADAALAVPGARAVRMTAEGQVAFIGAATASGDNGRLVTVVLAAGGGPRVVHETTTSVGPIVSVSPASAAPQLAVIGRHGVQLYLVQQPRQPAPYGAARFAADLVARGVVAGELHPGGRWLFVVVAEGNQLLLFDAGEPERPTVAAAVDLAPGELVPLARDLVLSADGATAWVLIGDGAVSLAAGRHETRVVEVALSFPSGPSGPPGLLVTRTVAVPGAAAPVGLALVKPETASGAAVRDAGETGALLVTAVAPSLLAAVGDGTGDVGARAVAALASLAEPGMVVRTDRDGRGGPLFSAALVLGPLIATPDATRAVALAWRRVDGGAVEFGVAVAPIGAASAPAFVRLGDASAAGLSTPFAAGHVAIQP